jgi:hypothetical protein
MKNKNFDWNKEYLEETKQNLKQSIQNFIMMDWEIILK